MDQDHTEYRAARDDEIEACVELQHQVFRPHEDDAPDRYRSYVRDDPSYRPGLSRVALVEGRIVSHLRIWERVLNVRGTTLKAGGVGSLLCLPEYRGRGIASGVLADAERFFLEEGYDLGLLFTIIGTPYYDNRGWTPLPLPTFSATPNSPSVGERVGRGVDLNLDDHLDVIRNIHRVECDSSTGSCERTATYWNDGPARLRGVFPRTGVEVDGRLVAYANWEDRPEGIWVTEAAAIEGCGAAIVTLAETVVSAASGGAIEGSLRRDNPLAACLGQMREMSWSVHDEMMVKMTDWARLDSRLSSVGVDIGPAPPKSRSDTDSFWRVLFGCALTEDRDTVWWDRLGPCPPLFYSWADIF